MPIYVGTTTVNTAIANSTITVDQTKSFAYATSNRNSIRPSLLLDFARSKTVDPRITFTRASSATYFNNLGVLTTAASNVPRIDYNPSTLVCNGLLVEQASTNLLTYSSAIGGTNWSNFGTAPTLTLNAAVAPDGTTTATKSVPGTAAGFYDTTQLFSYTAGSYYTLSVWVKQSGTGYTIIHLQMYDYNATYGGYPGAWIQITGNGSVLSTSNGITASNASATVTAYPNGWYRCTLSGIPSSASSPTTSIYAVIRPSLVNGDNNMGSGGDGTSGYYYWGAQVEQVAFPTSYIPTTSSAASRAVDRTILTGTNFSSWYNATNWTTTVSAIPATIPNTSGSEELLFQFTIDGANRILSRINSTNSVLTSYWINNIGQPQNGGGYNSASLTANTLFKHGMTASNGSWNLALNGTIYNSSTGYLITPASLSIGWSNDDGKGFNGWIQRFAYYPVALSNTELISLTS
jgi:hypothetical protein